MPKGSGGGGRPGRSGGGGDSSQKDDGSAYNKATEQIATLDREIAKTNEAYDRATQSENFDQRRELRKLRRALEDKKAEIERNRAGMRAVFKIPK